MGRQWYAMKSEVLIGPKGTSVVRSLSNVPLGRIVTKRWQYLPDGPCPALQEGVEHWLWASQWLHVVLLWSQR